LFATVFATGSSQGYYKTHSTLLPLSMATTVGQAMLSIVVEILDVIQMFILSLF
jgi:hypothetical protein